MESELLNRKFSRSNAFLICMLLLYSVAASASQQFSFSPVNIKQARMIYGAESLLFQDESQSCYIAMTMAHQDSVATCLYGLSWEENGDSLFFSQQPEGYVFDIENNPNCKADSYSLAIGKDFLSAITSLIHDASLLSSFVYADNNAKRNKFHSEKVLFFFGNNSNFFYTHYLDSTSQKLIKVFEEIALGTRLGDKGMVLRQEKEILQLHKVIEESIPNEVLNEYFFNNIESPSEIHKRIVEKENEQRKAHIISYIFILAACLVSIYLFVKRIKESNSNKNM